MNTILYYYHRMMRFVHTVPGAYQSQVFKYHHHKMKYYKKLKAPY